MDNDKMDSFYVLSSLDTKWMVDTYIEKYKLKTKIRRATINKLILVLDTMVNSIIMNHDPLTGEFKINRTNTSNQIGSEHKVNFFNFISDTLFKKTRNYRPDYYSTTFVFKNKAMHDELMAFIPPKNHKVDLNRRISYYFNKNYDIMRKKSLSQLFSYDDQVNEILLKKGKYYKVKRFRVYDKFTKLSSDQRCDVMFKNKIDDEDCEDLVQIDIINASIVFVLSKLLSDNSWYNTDRQLQSILKLAENGEFYEYIQKLVIAHNKSIQLKYNVETGLYYDESGLLDDSCFISKNGVGKYSRKIIKKEINIIFNQKKKKLNFMYGVFRSIKKYHKSFAKLIDSEFVKNASYYTDTVKIECDIIQKYILYTLYEEDRFALSVHDAVFVRESDLNRALELFESAKDKFNVKFNIKIN